MAIHMTKSVHYKQNKHINTPNTYRSIHMGRVQLGRVHLDLNLPIRLWYQLVYIWSYPAVFQF